MAPCRSPSMLSWLALAAAACRPQGLGSPGPGVCRPLCPAGPCALQGLTLTTAGPACTRCLETATHALHGLKVEGVKVEEYVRETLGEDTCDARRSVSDPDSSLWEGKCAGELCCAVPGSMRGASMGGHRGGACMVGACMDVGAPHGAVEHPQLRLGSMLTLMWGGDHCWHVLYTGVNGMC